MRLLKKNTWGSLNDAVNNIIGHKEWIEKDGSFSSCSSLQYIQVSENNQYYMSSVFGDLYTKDGKTLLKCPEGKTINMFIIPNHVTTIATCSVFCKDLSNIIIPNSVTTIETFAFSNYCSLSKVFYQGTKNDWKNISIDFEGNDNLKSATIYYYSETKPTSKGNYWHYDEEGKIAVW